MQVISTARRSRQVIFQHGHPQCTDHVAVVLKFLRGTWQAPFVVSNVFAGPSKSVPTPRFTIHARPENTGIFAVGVAVLSCLLQLGFTCMLLPIAVCVVNSCLKQKAYMCISSCKFISTAWLTIPPAFSPILPSKMYRLHSIWMPWSPLRNTWLLFCWTSWRPRAARVSCHSAIHDIFVVWQAKFVCITILLAISAVICCIAIQEPVAVC